MSELKQDIYEHGGSRIYVEDEDGRPNLLVDTYHTADFARNIKQYVSDWLQGADPYTRPSPWIPVTERLPPDEPDTIPYVDDGKVCYGCSDWVLREIAWHGPVVAGITHWREKLQPPQEGEG